MDVPLIDQADALLRVALAGLFGGLIGIERGAKDKPAGARTFAFVAAGAAVFTLAGALTFPDPDSTARVVAQVATGIGFVGAGTIIHLRSEVIGLTTAASIWAVAAIGICFALGLPLLGAGVSVLLFALLRVAGPIRRLEDGLADDEASSEERATSD